MTLLQQTIQAYLEDHHPNWTTTETEHHNYIRITNCGTSENKIIVNTAKQIIHTHTNQRYTTVKCSEITLLQQITNTINQINSQ